MEDNQAINERLSSTVENEVNPSFTKEDELKDAFSIEDNEIEETATHISDELPHAAQNIENPKSPETIESQSVVSLSTEVLSDNYQVFGVSFLGRSHEVDHQPCQDYHIFKDIGDGWHVYVISDGAGSAKCASRGSKATAESAVYLAERLIEKGDLKKRNTLSELEWHVEFVAICRRIKEFIIEQLETLDEDVRLRDFNATLEMLIVTPDAMLIGHIGDGRMGYQDNNGDWHSMIIPHKGSEPHQTVFLLNKWDSIRVPAFSMSGVYVPETRVVKDRPRSVVLMTDGCENFSWECVQFDEAQQIYVDLNRPFDKFLTPLRMTLEDAAEDGKQMDEFLKFIDTSTNACVEELDDRTFLFGMYDEI